MTENECTELGPLSRSIRMNRLLSRLCCCMKYTRSARDLADLAEVAPLMEKEYEQTESQYRFSLRDTSDKAVKTFDFVDRGVLRERTRKGPVYWIDTASGRYISTKGDYFEYLLDNADDDIRLDAWHLRKYEAHGWTDVRREGEYMQYLKFEQKSNGAVYYHRKVTKNNAIITLTKNGKSILPTLNGRNKNKGMGL